MSENKNKENRIKKTIKKLSKKIMPIYLDNFLFKMRVIKYKNFPRSIFIETTNKCNAKCPMCPRGKGLMKRSIGTMEMSLFKKIIDECKQRKEVKNIMLYGDGEPLMDEFLAERIRYIKKNCSRLYVQISTNCSLFTRKKAKEILLAGPDTITLSLDSMNKQTYTKARGLNYDTVIKNIMNLIEIKKELGSNTKLVVRLIKTKLTYKGEEEFKRFWKDKCVDIEIKPAHNFLDTDLRIGSNKKVNSFSLCKKLWRDIEIYWDGDVPICCRDYNGEQLVGNVRNQSVESIWKNEKFSNLRRTHLSLVKIKDLSPCNRCSETKRDIPAIFA